VNDIMPGTPGDTNPSDRDRDDDREIGDPLYTVIEAAELLRSPLIYRNAKCRVANCRACADAEAGESRG
jgi:hypothetical protein